MKKFARACKNDVKEKNNSAKTMSVEEKYLLKIAANSNRKTVYCLY